MVTMPPHGVPQRTGSQPLGRLVGRPRTPSNERMELTAPRGDRAGNVGVDAAASRSPFGERRRRSSSAVLGGRITSLSERSGG